MDGSHTAYGGGGGDHWASDVVSEDDFINMLPDFDSLTANDPAIAPALDHSFSHAQVPDSFDAAFAQTSFLGSVPGPETLPQPAAAHKLAQNAATVNVAALLKRQSQSKASGSRRKKGKQAVKAKSSASSSASATRKQNLSAWGLAMHGCSELHGADDADAVSCSSSCPGSCPSQCGAKGQGSICCDDDSCEAADLCLDEACEGATHPCTDTSCIRDGPVVAGAASTSGQRDEVVAAAALASFVDPSATSGLGGGEQLNSYGQGYSAHGDQHNSFGMDFCCMPPGDSSSFDGLAMNASMQCQHGPHDPCWQRNPSIFLASHIMQFHDPAHGASQHTRPCIADNPNLVLSKCSLPRFSSHDSLDFNFDINQDPSFQCGFPVDDPANFAQHLFTQHRSFLSGISPHASCFNFANQGQFMEDFHGGHHFSMAHNQSPYHLPSSGLPPGEASAGCGSWSASASPGTNASMTNTPLLTPVSPPTPPLPLTDKKPDEASSLRKVNLAPSSGLQVQTSSLDEVYQCCWKDAETEQICNKRFTNSDELDAHCRADHVKMAKKTKDGYMCMWQPCKRTECFPQRGKLNRHLQTHTGFKPMECPICNLKLSAKQSLEQHMRTHTNEAPYVCAYGCGQTFKQHSALTMHHRTHSGEKPLSCEICGARFRESSNLTKHRRTHMLKGMHECGICNKDFHRLDQLRRHLNSNHKDKPEAVAEALLKATRGRRDVKQYNRALTETTIDEHASTLSTGLTESSPEPAQQGGENDFMSDMIMSDDFSL